MNLIKSILISIFLTQIAYLPAMEKAEVQPATNAQSQDNSPRVLYKDKKSFLGLLPKDLYGQLVGYLANYNRGSANYLNLITNVQRVIQRVNCTKDTIATWVKLPTHPQCTIIHNNTCIVGLYDGHIEIYDLNTKKLIQQLAIAANPTPIKYLASDPATNRLFAIRRDGLIDIWDLNTNSLIHTIITGCSDAVQSLAFNSLKNELYSEGSSMIKVWDLSDYSCVKTVNLAPETYGYCKQVDLRTNKLYIGTNNGTLQIWDLDTFSYIKEYLINAHDVLKMSLDAQNNKLYIADFRTVTCFDTDSSKKQSIFSLGKLPIIHEIDLITHIEINSHSNILTILTLKYFILVDLNTGKTVYKIPYTNYTTNCDGHQFYNEETNQLIVTFAQDRSLTFWDFGIPDTNLSTYLLSNALYHSKLQDRKLDLTRPSNENLHQTYNALSEEQKKALKAHVIDSEGQITENDMITLYGLALSLIF